MGNLPRSIAELDKGGYILVCTGGPTYTPAEIQGGAHEAAICFLPRGCNRAQESPAVSSAQVGGVQWASQRGF